MIKSGDNQRRGVTMIGQTLGHYRIVTKLGEGGMGAVYQAEDLRLERPVALKFLSAGQAVDARARERLLTEARVASRLNHPNIATVYDVGETEATPFIAMEFVAGQTLRDVLKRGVLPAAELLEIARQIAEGLQAAHQAGVLHRDIKPGNIMLLAGNRVKILDFGLAVVAKRDKNPQEDTDDFITHTATQYSASGTVPYMSPELLRGESPDPRADIFSFGVLLYECLSGRLPFRGETAIDVLHAILHQVPLPLASLIPDISPQWERLIAGCLAKDPRQRFASMREVIDRLPSDAARTTRAEKSVAVLYFENLSSAQDDQYFRDGITEDIITELSKINELRVFPRSAVVEFRDKPMTAP
jgi:serine/threonine protein kinase